MARVAGVGNRESGRGTPIRRVSVGRSRALPVVSEGFPASVPAPLGRGRIAPRQAALQGKSGRYLRYPPGVSGVPPAPWSPPGRRRHPAARRMAPGRTPEGFRVFDTLSEAVISSAGRRRAKRFRARGAFVCLLGSEPTAPRPLERIARQPHEADLPAQEAAPRQGARLPRPDEVDRGPSRPRRSSGEGPQAADGLTDGRGHKPPRQMPFQALPRTPHQ